ARRARLSLSAYAAPLGSTSTAPEAVKRRPRGLALRRGAEREREPRSLTGVRDRRRHGHVQDDRLRLVSPDRHGAGARRNDLEVRGGAGAPWAVARPDRRP